MIRNICEEWLVWLDYSLRSANKLDSLPNETISTLKEMGGLSLSLINAMQLQKNALKLIC